MKIRFLDNRKYHMSKEDIQKYKGEITKQVNSPVCKTKSTFEVADDGVEEMKKQKFILVKGKIDV